MLLYSQINLTAILIFTFWKINLLIENVCSYWAHGGGTLNGCLACLGKNAHVSMKYASTYLLLTKQAQESLKTAMSVSDISGIVAS